MPNAIHISLEAKRQALTVTQAPPLLASDVVDFLRFEVGFSEEWDGFDEYAVILKNGETVRSCPIADGQACADRDALENAGVLEIALAAYKDGARLTTERVTIRLHDSGI